MPNQLRPFEDFVWHKGNVWLYEGTLGASGRVMLAHPFYSHEAVSALRREVRKVSRDEHVAVLAAIDDFYERLTDPRHRRRVHNPRRAARA